MDILIRKASEQDLPWLLAMERETFSDAWTEKNLEDSLRLHPEDNYIAVRPELCETENRHAGEAEPGGDSLAREIRLGYLLLMRAADEGEILRIAVSPVYKRKGVADAMMRALEIWAVSHGIKAVYLEVRADNEPAIALYKKNGFQVQGIRKHYYHDPECDAVIMSRIEDDVC
ncbi:MAG: ribosomal protein S18-alanine N-acetyltransferase [Lachnospiraceae bacterium]